MNEKPDNSVITYDEIVDTSASIDSNSQTTTYKMDYHVFHTFLLITIRYIRYSLILLIILAINCYYNAWRINKTKRKTITCDEIVNVPKTITIDSIEKKQHIKLIIIIFTLFC